MDRRIAESIASWDILTEGKTYKGITWIAHSCFKITVAGITILTDPFNYKGGPVDLCLISHPHDDHCDLASVRKACNKETTILTTKDTISKIKGIGSKEHTHILNSVPGDYRTYVYSDDLYIVGEPAYNTHKDRPNHPKSNKWLGFGIYFESPDFIIYFAGDTDIIPEMKKFRPHVAILPVSGIYVMDPTEAAFACKIMKPKVAIPMHYGSMYKGRMLGTPDDAKKFKELASKYCKVVLL